MAKNVKVNLTVRDKGSKEIAKFSKTTKNSLDKLHRNVKTINVDFAKLTKRIKVMTAAAVAFGTAFAISFGKDAIKAASDFEEVSSKFSVVFKGVEKAAEAAAENLVDNFGLSTTAAKQFLSSIQDLLVPMGLLRDEAERFSDKIVQLAVDLGSFNNVGTADVMRDIQSALVGNYETMKKYGVILNETVVKENAYASGLAEVGDTLTAQQKALSTYSLIVKGSSDAIGDWARTSGGFANQMKQLHSNIEEFNRLVGAELIKNVNDVVKAMNDWFKANQELVKVKIVEYLNKIKGVAEDIWKILNYDPLILEAGLIGLLVFGRKGAVVVGGLAHITKTFTNLGKGIALVSHGVITFKDLASANFKELDNVINNFYESIAEGNKIPILTTKSTEDYEKLKGFLEDQLAFYKETSKKLQVNVERDKKKIQELSQPIDSMVTFKVESEELEYWRKSLERSLQLLDKANNKVKTYARGLEGLRRPDKKTDKPKPTKPKSIFKNEEWDEWAGLNKYIKNRTDGVNALGEAWRKLHEARSAAPTGMEKGATDIAIKESEELRTKILEHTQQMADAWREVGDSVTSNFTDNIVDAITTTGNFSDAFSQMASSIGADLLRIATKMIFLRSIEAAFGGTSIGGIFGFKDGGITPSIPGAAGGAVFNGPKTGYLANLHGNEAVIPLKNGAVPVSLSGGAGTGMTNHISINVDARGSNMNAEEQYKLGETISKIVDTRVKTIMRDEQRVGGINRQRRY